MEVTKLLMHAVAGSAEKHALILQMTESARFFPVSGLEARQLQLVALDFEEETSRERVEIEDPVLDPRHLLSSSLKPC